jgi:zinc protease
VTVWPDVQEGREQEALEAMLGVLDAIAENGPTEDELEHVRSGMRRTAADPTQTGVYLDTDSFDELVGGEVLSRAELIAMQDALTAEEVAAMASTLRDAAIWVVPEAVRMPDGAPGPTSTSSDDRVEGTRFRRRGKGLRRRSPESLVLGDEGATLELAGGQVITVRFADCEALLAWGDGDRELIGRDGFRLWLVPSEWKRADEILARLDAGVDPDHRVERSMS